MKDIDYIVVGSSFSGAMAAQTLVESGARVVMLDVGLENPDYTAAIPAKDFLTLRKTDPEQYRYFIGKKLEGVGWGKVGKGEQVTPPRKHLMSRTNEIIPINSDTFSPAESLAYGGLGVGWGIGCWEFSGKELASAGLSSGMPAAYEVVAQRIGISATRDDAADYTLGSLTHFQPSPDLDNNHKAIYERYKKQRDWLKNNGFHLGRTPLALLTQNMGERQEYNYDGMDFYSDTRQSAYRPWMTVNELRKKPNFTYIGNQLVLDFADTKNGVDVRCIHVENGTKQTFSAKKLVLGCGVLGTARIVLRSFKDKTVKLPLLCNPYSYVPCLQPALTGKAAEQHKLGFAQLSFFLDESGDKSDVAMASLYSYQSLMLFRMARQVPLDFAGARQLLQYLSSGLVIMGIHQPDTPSANKYVSLVADAKSPTGDTLNAFYSASDTEKETRTRREKKYCQAMRSLGAYPLKVIDPGFGSSIHYAGSLPFNDTPKPYTLNRQGKLHNTHNVFVADSSGFTYLPAKGLTFSIMANAHITAENALHG